MKENVKKIISFMAILILVLLLSGCTEKSSKPSSGISKPATEYGNSFQKNMHQSTASAIPYTCEARHGYYFQYDAFAYYIDRETKSAAILCSKPECTHQDDTCNAWIFCSSLSHSNGALYYTNNDYVLKNGSYRDCGTLLYSMEPDGTKHHAIQALEVTPGANDSGYISSPIIHKGYVYFACNNALYRAPLGEDIQQAEKIFEEKTRNDNQNIFEGFLEEETSENIEHTTIFDPDAIRYTLWADGEDIYFMTNIKQPDGTLKDTLFSYHSTDNETKKLWQTPDASEAGTWETTGVSVSQWYLTNGYLYFYLSGGDLWRANLDNGKNEKLAKVSRKTKYGTAIFSDQYICVVNDRLVNKDSIRISDSFRTGGDTIFVYGLDGTFIKKLSLKTFTKKTDTNHYEMVFCSGDDIYFLANATTWKDFVDGVSYPDTRLALCCIDIKSGEITQVYKWKKHE